MINVTIHETKVFWQLTKNEWDAPSDGFLIVEEGIFAAKEGNRIVDNTRHTSDHDYNFGNFVGISVFPPTVVREIKWRKYMSMGR